jgi:competence protein ComEC
MESVQVRMRLLLIVTLLGLANLVWVVPLVASDLVAQVGGWQRVPYLQVHFLDVGQGDAIFIETPDGVQVLIDGGPDATVLRELSKVMPFYDRTIDVVVGTHPDKDHVGGLTDVLERYEVALIVKTENVNDTSVSRLFESRVAEEEAEVFFARRGQRLALGASTTLEILYPESNPADMESNAASIVARLIYGDIAFMLTGDSPKSIEEYLVLVEGENLASDVLKVGHHGSRTSTSELFLDEVQPTYAVVSAGADNQYGHPHVEVTDALFNAGAKVYETAEVGTVTFMSDGETVWVQ